MAREMLLETREAFEYVECETCGTIQIVDIPADLEPYYPENYRHPLQKPGQLGRMLRAQRGAYVRGARWNLLGNVMLHASRPEWVEWMTHTNATADSRILDVGTGDGALLTALSAAGYRNLTGIDPFVDPADDPGSGVRTFRRTMDDEQGTYDIVMLHHSLEHMPDPAAAMQHVRRLLRPGGWALVRMPVAGTTAGAATASTGWPGASAPSGNPKHGGDAAPGRSGRLRHRIDHVRLIGGAAMR